MILGSRKEKRPLEKVLQVVSKVINPLLIGTLKKYRGFEAENIARAMINAANQLHDKIGILHWEEMIALLPEKEKKK